MRNKILFGLAAAGILASLTSAYVYGLKAPPLPPAFNPAANPYERGVYANGIIESEQPAGENINVYPEVPGVITRILVAEGQVVEKGATLLEIEDSVQAATVAQLKAQAEAAKALLEELRAEPRKETLDVSVAQVVAARAAVRTTRDEYSKQRHSYRINSRSVSRDALDTAFNNMVAAKTNLIVAQRQYDLTRAGAWIYDIRNQENQYEALVKAAASAEALLSKYKVRSTVDGKVLALNAAVGSYISPQGAYNTYTQVFTPVVVLGSEQQRLAVRCFVDEILIAKLPPGPEMQAEVFIRGTNIRIPVKFERMQPYVTPKIELSNELTERVDVRVLPVIFTFTNPPNLDLYAGELVDVYIKAKPEPVHDGTPVGKRP